MKTKLSTLIMAFAGLMYCNYASAQLSGTYTINSAASTSGTNFNSFSDLSSALSSDGVSGPVEVNVVASSGPYYESVTFSQITGASATNTITINGNDESLIATSGSAACPLKLNGADYFIFNGLRLQSAVNSVGARCVQIYNEADYNVIKNCDMWISSYSGTDQSTAFIAFSPQANGNLYGDHGKGNHILNNTMRGDTGSIGPYWGIYDNRYGHEDSSANTLIRGNDISGAKGYCIYLTYANGVQIISNAIHDPNSGVSTIVPIQVSNCESSELHNSLRIDSNEIYKYNGERVSTIALFDNAGTESKPISVSNNYIHSCSGSIFIYGPRIQRCDFVNLVGNTIKNCSASSSFSYPGASIRECTNIKMTNGRVSGISAYNSIGTIFTIYQSDTVELSHYLIDSNTTETNLIGVFNSYQGTALDFHSNEITANSCPSLRMTYFSSTNGISFSNNIIHNNSSSYEDALVLTLTCLNVKVLHNSFHWKPSGNNENGIYFGNSSSRAGYECKNNILYIDSVGTGVIRPLFAPNADQIEWDNNVYYLDNLNTITYFTTSTQYSTFSDWAADAGDTSSILADPEFEDLYNGNLRPTNSSIDNIGTPGLVDYDFEGTERSNTPDPGALEFDAYTCNLSSSLYSYPDSTNDVIGSLNTKAETNQMFIAYGPQNMIIACQTTGGDDNSYSFSGDYLSSGSTDSSVVFSPEEEGVFTITCIVTSGDCADTSEIDICVIDATGDHPNNNSYKVKICHQPDDASDNPVTISISINAVQTHLNGHDGCRLGACTASCSSSDQEDQTEFDDPDQYMLYGYEGMQILVQPNPSTSTFDIVLDTESDEAVQVQLYDITGKLLSTEMYYNTSFTLGAELPTGIYFIKVIQGNHVETIKLIKE